MILLSHPLLSSGSEIGKTSKAWSSKRDPEKTPVSFAVDAEHKPLVLYHATNADFDKFETGRKTTNSNNLLGNFETERHGIFTTPDPEFAQNYFKGDKDAKVLPLYMNLKSPMDFTKGAGLDSYLDDLEEQGINPRWMRGVQHDWELFDGE